VLREGAWCILAGEHASALGLALGGRESVAENGACQLRGEVVLKGTQSSGDPSSDDRSSFVGDNVTESRGEAGLCPCGGWQVTHLSLMHP
jgi:hypothetical protein